LAMTKDSSSTAAAPKEEAALASGLNVFFDT